MPKLLDSIALSLALAACSPMAAKTGPNGQHSRTPDQISAVVSAPASAQAKPAVPAIADGYECKRLQNAVKNDVTRCCLTLKPYNACHEVETAKAENFAKENTVSLNGRTVPNYTQFKDGIPPSVYMNYLAGSAKNATELATVLSAFIQYQEIQDDNMLTPEEILSMGSGDCDNMSNLFVKLLETLGKKSGYDYKAKVVGLDGANHAVAIFNDTDGKWKAFDLQLPFNEMRQINGRADLYSASSLFDGVKGMSDRSFYERKKLGPAAGAGAKVDNFLNLETLIPSGREIAATVDLDYSPDFNPDSILNGYNWRQTEVTHIHFRKGYAIYFHSGVLSQVTEPTKITLYENNAVNQIQYSNHPKIATENFDVTGQLVSRILRNGDGEVYNNGVIFQRLYAKGPIALLVYFPTGELKQKDYRDGRVEWFNEAGHMIQKKDRRGKITILR